VPYVFNTLIVRVCVQLVVGKVWDHPAVLQLLATASGDQLLQVRSDYYECIIIIAARLCAAAAAGAVAAAGRRLRGRPLCGPSRRRASRTQPGT
jgi:hypothetical protein